MDNIDYDKYKIRLSELYPSLSEEEKKEILKLRYEYWEVVFDNFSTYFSH